MVCSCSFVVHIAVILDVFGLCIPKLYISNFRSDYFPWAQHTYFENVAGELQSTRILAEHDFVNVAEHTYFCRARAHVLL